MRWLLGCLLVMACGDDSATPSSNPDAAVTPDGPAACGAGVQPGPGLVVTESGALQGAMAGSTWSWQGVRYAAPPVGDLRWRAPAAPACASGIVQATSFGNQCPQLDTNNSPTGDEDCLFLNVWAPQSASGPLPVMFFIHGGGNAQGAGSLPTYDGAALAEKNVVVVTINYRLGQLGFLASTALSAESPHGVSGNYGVLDQIAALQWVQRNIAAFGGDVHNVTIFGESAGGVDVCTLVASPLATGLFHRAIIESGGCFQKPLAQAVTNGDSYTQMAGCSDTNCLRALPVATVLDTMPITVDGLHTSAFQPVVDGYVLAKSPVDALSTGTHNHVPIIIGNNADETSRMVANVTTDAQYQAALVALYGQTLATQIAAHYPSSSFPTPRAALVRATTDGRFVCPSRLMVRAAVAGQTDHPVYRFMFNHGLDHGAAAAFGAFHGLELPFVFGNLNLDGYVPSTAETQLSQDMQSYWSQFARAGDPNATGLPMWVTQATGSDHYQALDDTIVAADGVRTADCDFWDSL